MGRLIDADKLLDDIRKKAKAGFPANKNLSLYAESCVIHAPTVYAVPVVRCKDCKHSREQNKDEKKYLVEDVLICTSCDATENGWNPVWPEHFCSCGERKDNE